MCHAEHYFPAPIESIDAVMPGRTSARDLPAELIPALAARGIRYMMYYHVGHDHWREPDGCFYYPLNPDFRALTSIAKTGNPGRVICYNPWIWPRMTDFQEYFCGEGYRFLTDHHYLPADGSGVFIDGPHAGLQAHTNFILEQHWLHPTPDTPIPSPIIDKKLFVSDMLAGIEHGIVPSVNLEIYQDGGCSPESLEYLRAVRDSL